MSHIQKINLEVKNIKALKKATEKLGLVFTEGVKSFSYYGSSRAKCDHTIGHPDDTHKIGVCAIKGQKAFELKWDPGYLGKAQPIVGNRAQILKQEYAVAVATMEAESQGMFVSRYDRPDGSVRLEASFN